MLDTVNAIDCSDDTDRHEANTMKRLITLLSPISQKEDILDSLQKLYDMMNENEKKKFLFLSKGGLLSIPELLSCQDDSIIELALQLINLICKDDLQTLRAVCAVGVSPFIFSKVNF